MKVLVTGGAGFIGSHLAEALLAKGDEVYILDDLSTGREDNIKHLQSNQRFHYIFDTIMNKDLLTDLVSRSDAIFHFAAAVGVSLIVKSPVKTIETNVQGTENVLEAASKNKKLVILASTSEVYGKSSEVPFLEKNDLVLGPTTIGRWSYACSKAVDEFLALAYWRERKCPTIIVRLFNTVGPRQTGRYGMVLPRFICQALSNAPITVYVTGEQTRCFTWVNDVVQGIIELASHPHAIGEVYNLGSTEEISILNLAYLVRDLTHSKSEVKLVSYAEEFPEDFEDMQRRVPSIEKARSLVGYKPTLDLAGIISIVAEYYKEKGVEVW